MSIYLSHLLEQLCHVPTMINLTHFQYQVAVMSVGKKSKMRLLQFQLLLADKWTGTAQSVQWLHYKLDAPVVWILAKTRDLPWSKKTRPVPDAIQPPIQWVLEYFSRLKWSGHDVDHSPPTTAKVKNEWSYISTPPDWLHDVYRENFTYSLSKCFIYERMTIYELRQCDDTWMRDKSFRSGQAH